MNQKFSLPRLYLASQSPRRKQLLESLGLPFEVKVQEIEEAHPDTTNYREVILDNAVKKAEASLDAITDKESVIIAADTLVVLSNHVLGKPKDKTEAVEMLSQLSGKEQKVFTGLVLHSKKFGLSKSLVESRVFFRKLSEADIDGYTSTIEPYDKAGGYAVQGIGAKFIDRIEGSYTNVMGLPIETFLRELEELTRIPIYHWIPQHKY